MRKKKGQALMEVALALPILLLFFCGIVDFGRILHASETLNIAAQESVRLSGLGKSDIEVEAFAKEKAYFKDKTEIDVDINPKDNDPLRKPGTYVTVDITYNIKYITPLINKFLGSTYVVHGKSTIRVE